MPFKSKAQMRKIASLEQQGKLPKGTFQKWLEHTPSPKQLPQKVSKPSSKKR